MRLASNVVVHDPEVNPTRIDSDRLRTHGWPKAAVEQFESDLQVADEIEQDALINLLIVESKA
jgi:hypothetical protein